jgi:hypothetical protein
LSLGSKAAFIAIIGYIYGAIKVFKELDEASQDFMKTLGATRSEVKGLLNASLDVYSSLAKYGTELDSVLDASKALVDEYGSLAKIDKALVQTTAMVAHSFGVSADVAATLVRLQRETLGLSQKQLDINMKNIKAVSKVYNVGAGKIAEDIAASAEQVALFTNSSMSNIIETAAYARRLGVTFGDIAQIAESLLDIQSSTSAAMEAQVLFGRRIDIVEARRHALLGETTQMTNSILKNFEGIQSTNELNYFQMKALSGLLGVSADKAAQLLNNFIGMKDMSNEVRSAIEKYEGLSMSDALELSDATSQLRRVSALFKGLFIQVVKPMVPIITGVLEMTGDLLQNFMNGEIWTGLGKVAGSLTAVFLAMRYGVPLLGKLTGRLGKLLGKIPLLSKATGGLGKVLTKIPGAGKVGGMFGKMFSFGGGLITSMLKGAAALVVLGAGLWVMGKAMQNFIGIDWKTFGIAMLSVAALGTMGVMLGTFGPQAILGGIALAALGAGLFVVGKAMQGFIGLD